MFLESSVLLYLMPMLDIYISSRLGLSVFLLSVEVEGWSTWCLLCGIVCLPHCTLIVYCDGCPNLIFLHFLHFYIHIGTAITIYHQSTVW